ncbi:MAG: Fe-S cluster assembly protein SufD [Polyangiaceae bacterium]|nr:Fe-S cluster assembly protein SufD [Polyangiaceae bacterium]
MTVSVSPQRSVLFDQGLAQLDAVARSGEPAWLSELRQPAVLRYREQGLPHARQEAWRVTPLGPTLATPFGLAAPAREQELVLSRVQALLGPPRGQRAVIVNGRARLGAESRHGPWHVGTLADSLAGSTERGALCRYLGQEAPLSDGFVALNQALFSDAVWAVLPRGQAPAEPLELVVVSVADDRAVVSYPRVLLVVEQEARARVVETHMAFADGQSCLCAPVAEVVVEPGAVLDHARILDGSARAHSVGLVAVRQGAGSRYGSLVTTLGGQLSRLDLRVLLEGPGAECSLDGLYVADGGELVDHHTSIEHAQPRCTSLEHYRGIVSDRARSVFDGTIVVRRDAQKTSARQENRNLVLSDEATVHTKPHLEIDADDVTCSHGATIGQISADELYYLRARGIEPEVGRALLTQAFARELMERVLPPWVGPNATGRVLGKLPLGDRLEGLS